ncbi:MAG: YggS family pyridoxal phosphate-dependent enzyme [Johnsonella sp.]|nr:YggS family pyridoxal phosphate-dependent enzyme [Johnsonella sp.]
MIKENLSLIRQNICKSCQKVERDPDEVKLIAVSKTKPLSLIREAYDCGIRDFGENKVKEILEKKPLLPADIRWHMIGHLQTNKVRPIIREVAMIHSVDSIRLADCIDTEGRKAGIIVEGLLQVNIAGEESKFGFPPDELMESLERLSVYRFFKIKGLMTVAPFVKNPEYNRNIFLKLRDFSVDIKRKKIDNISMDFLSMGMTEDYSVAIEEGADYIRIGTALFGAREIGRGRNEYIG